MVAPSCCLEYRPTATFWGILLFIILPIIYFFGKVVGTVITVLARVLYGLCKWALWDEEDYEEAQDEQRLERQARLLAKEQARMARRQDRALRRNLAAALECAKKNEQMTSLMANGAPRNGVAKSVSQTNNITESLNSECETDGQPVTLSVTESVEKTMTLVNGQLPNGTEPTETPILTNGHVNGPNVPVHVNGPTVLHVNGPTDPVTGETGTTTMITTQLWHRKRHD